MTKREEYDTIPAVNFSRLKWVLRSPLAYYRDGDETPEPKTCMMIGSLLHSVLLEGVDLSKLICIKPDGMNLSTTQGKEWKRRQAKPIVSHDEARDIYGMVGAVLDNRHARGILATCLRREIIYTGSIHGVPCKGLIDAIGSAEGEPALVEVKTSVDVRPEFFSKRVVSEPFHYDLQCALYRTLTTCRISCWIVVEPKAPYDVAVYFPSQNIRDSGSKKLNKALAVYRLCKQADRWPGSVPDPTILDTPSWYRTQTLELSAEETKLLEG